MDPVNGLASIITLLQVSAFLTKSAINLYQGLRDAPIELAAVVNHGALLQAQLAQLAQLSGEELAKSATADMLKGLQELLAAASQNITEVEGLCSRLNKHDGIRSRVQWVLLDKRTSEKAQARLRVTESSLTAALQIVAVRQQFQLAAKVDEIGDLLKSSHIVQTVGPRPNGLRKARASLQRRRLQTGQRSRDPAVTRMQYSSAGLQGSLVRTSSGDSKRTDWSLGLRLELPLTWVFGKYALQANVAFSTFPLCRSLSLHSGSGVALARVLPESSKFMQACVIGDVPTVQSLLQSGEASLTDVTEHNWSPLALSIASGRLELVQMLLDCGAGVNWTFGLHQTSPLQWAVSSKQLDILRLLLRYGADQDHINALGWSAMFFCWSITRQGGPSMCDFMQLLVEDSFQDFDIIDQEGWTCLHRVAAFGTKKDLVSLIRHGANPMAESLPLKWNAIQHACFYGNFACYEALLPHFGNDVSDMLDERAWSLLHLAAASGSATLITTLLEIGCDPSAMTRPSVSGTMHESLCGRSCSPRDIAALESAEHLLTFDRALHDTTTRFEDGGDIFHDAPETNDSSIT